MPTPPFALTTTTIYARPNGDDKCGDGSLDKPFATFQQAIRFVPNILAPGASYIVDITDIGVETLPTDYEFPVIQSTTLLGNNEAPPSPFLFQSGLSVRATPKLVALPPGDAVISSGAITEDSDTGLIILTIGAARASWAGGSLKGKQIIRTVGAADASCCIYDSNTTQLFLCNNADAFNGGAGPLVLAPGEVLQIVEPSATLEAPPPNNTDGQAIRCANINSVAFQGIRFRCSVPDTAFALCVANSPIPFFELCDIDGLFATSGNEQIGLFSTTLRLGLDVEGSDCTPRRSYWTGVGTGAAGYLFMNGFAHAFRTTVVEGCEPVENGEFGGTIVTPSWVFQECLFLNSLGDGIRCVGGRYDLTDVKIQGSNGDGINAERGSNYVLLNHVTGVQAFAGSVGVRANDGAFVQITDTNAIPGPATTTITGAVDDVKAGDLPATSYASGLNQYDITAIGAGGATGTGSRIFERA